MAGLTMKKYLQDLHDLDDPATAKAVAKRLHYLEQWQGAVRLARDGVTKLQSQSDDECSEGLEMLRFAVDRLESVMKLRSEP